MKRAKAMFLNYPNNPTGACGSREFFKKAVAFAKKNDIAICYDNPYSEVVFEGQERLSFLCVEGAKDVAVELNSLSKPYNMTGWRIGMAMGNPRIIAAISKVKENTDSGIFNAVQFAGIKALKNENENIARMLEIYRNRRELVLGDAEEDRHRLQGPEGDLLPLGSRAEGDDLAGIHGPALRKDGRRRRRGPRLREVRRGLHPDLPDGSRRTTQRGHGADREGIRQVTGNR